MSNPANAVIEAAKNQVRQLRADARALEREIQSKQGQIHHIRDEIARHEQGIRAYEQAFTAKKAGEPAKPRRSAADWDKALREYAMNHGRQGATFSRRDFAQEFEVVSLTADKVFRRALDREPTPLLVEVGTEPRSADERGGRGRALYAYNEEFQQSGPIGSAPESAGNGQASAPVAGTGSQTVRGLPKETQAALRKALAQGARLIKTGDHYRLTQKGKPAVTVSSTPSDHRSLKNLKSQMRQARYPI